MVPPDSIELPCHINTDHAQVQDEKISTEEVHPDLFDDVLGYEDLKTLFLKTITGNPEDKIHFLMIGKFATEASIPTTVFLITCFHRKV